MAPEKEEFARLIAIMGWDKSEAARQLHVSHSAINHLLNPNHPNKPGGPTLKLLKMMVAGAHPEAIVSKKAGEPEISEAYFTSEERRLVQQLRDAPPEKQDEIRRVVHTMLSGVSHANPRRRKASPTVEGAAKRLLKAAARQLSQKYPPASPPFEGGAPILKVVEPTGGIASGQNSQIPPAKGTPIDQNFLRKKKGAQ